VITRTRSPTLNCGFATVSSLPLRYGSNRASITTASQHCISQNVLLAEQPPFLLRPLPTFWAESPFAQKVGDLGTIRARPPLPVTGDFPIAGGLAKLAAGKRFAHPGWGRDIYLATPIAASRSTSCASFLTRATVSMLTVTTCFTNRAMYCGSSARFGSLVMPLRASVLI
jgi:hypothetical protein